MFLVELIQSLILKLYHHLFQGTDFLPSPPILSPRAKTDKLSASMVDLKAMKPRQSLVRQSTRASMMLIHEIRKLEQMQHELGEDANTALEVLQKEAECLRLAQSDMNHDTATTISKLQEEINELKVGERETKVGKQLFPAIRESHTLRQEIMRLQEAGSAEECNAQTTIATLEEKLECVQKSIENMMLGSAPSTAVEADSPNNVKAINRQRKSLTPRRSLAYENNENNPPQNQPQSNNHDHAGKNAATPKKNNSVDIRKMQSMFKTAAEENIRSIRAYVTELKERVAKLQYQKQLLVCQVICPSSTRPLMLQITPQTLKSKLRTLNPRYGSVNPILM